MNQTKLLKLAHSQLSRHTRYVATMADVELVKSKLDTILPNIVDTYVAVTSVCPNEDILKSYQESTTISLFVCYMTEKTEVALTGEKGTITQDKHLIIEFSYNQPPVIYGEATIGGGLSTYFKGVFNTDIECESESELVSAVFVRTIDDHLTMLRQAEFNELGDTTFSRWNWQRVNDANSLFIRNAADAVGCMNLDWYGDGTIDVTVYGKYTVSDIEEELTLFEYVRNVIPSEKTTVWQKDDALGYMFEAITNYIEYKF